MSAVYQGRNRQLQLPVHRNLLINGHRVRFHKGKLEARHVFIADTFAVQRIEADPAACLRLPVPDGRAKVIRIAVQRGNQFLSGAVIHALGGYPLSVVRLPRVIGHIAHIIARLKERLDIQDQIFGVLPGRLHRIGIAFVTVIFQHVIPVHHAVGSCKGNPAAILCHLDDRRSSHRCAAATKGIPAPGTFTGMIAS